MKKANFWGEKATFGAANTRHWVCPRTGASQQRQLRGGEQTCRRAKGRANKPGPAAPLAQGAAGTAGLQFVGRAEAGAGPGLPAPSPGRERRVRTGSKGEAGAAEQDERPVPRAAWKDKGKLSSLQRGRAK